MSTGSRKRTRSERVAALDLPPGRWMRLGERLRRRDVVVRLTLCVLSAVAIWAGTKTWDPPFGYRVGYAPLHDIQARVRFEQPYERTPGSFTVYEVGQTLAAAGKPLSEEDVAILRLEHEAAIATLTPRERFYQRLYRSAAFFGLLAALYVLCGYYLLARTPRLTRSVQRFATALTLVVVTIVLARWLSRDPWRAELIPPLLLGLTLTITYGRELALLLSACVAVVIAVTIGQGVGALLLIVGTVAAAILMLGRIRTRSKLIRVGFLTGLVGAFLTVDVGLMTGQPLGGALLIIAGRNALWGFAAGFLMTGMLPYIERAFGVITEISLLELGDVAHPLLQELVRRAPGTYNHSINVASMAEAAAEAIGANGLLVRVGAYFHDIGKMFKPGYFIENMGQDPNRHESLVPAMSTLIIIAHVKDGADLARQHHLPQSIVDFIEQHHGTTLVEYFYRRASEQREDNPDGSKVEENAFRYPGPKPQTKEAAVLMLADAVESAARVLSEPTPARIDNLVHEIAMKRLLDEQFDECGLNLAQLRTIEDSLVKSLTAVYHGRVKYPSQRTA